MKYTTVVECRKCGRKGRLSAMVCHFRTKYVKPEHQRHYCTACNFDASRKHSMETHFLSKSHRLKCKGRGTAEYFRVGSVRAVRFSDCWEDNSCDPLTLSWEEARAFLDRGKDKNNSQESYEGSDVLVSSSVEKRPEVRSVVTRPILSMDDESADGWSPKDYTGLYKPEDMIILDTPDEPQASTFNAEPVEELTQVEEPQLSTSKMEMVAALSWAATDQVGKSQSSSSTVELVADSVVTDKAGKSQLIPSKTRMVTGSGRVPTAEMEEPRPSTSRMEVVQETPQVALHTTTTNVRLAVRNGHMVDDLSQQPPLVAPGLPKLRIILLRGGKTHCPCRKTIQWVPRVHNWHYPRADNDLGIKSLWSATPASPGGAGSHTEQLRGQRGRRWPSHPDLHRSVGLHSNN